MIRFYEYIFFLEKAGCMFIYFYKIQGGMNWGGLERGLNNIKFFMCTIIRSH